MILQRQTIVSNPKKGVKGNCLATCVACLFNMPVSKVPHFIELGDDAWGELAEFCDKNGYEFNGWWYNPPKNWSERFSGVDGFTIVGGDSPRGNGRKHAVIYQNGLPYFDVHPEGTFLKKVDRIFLINKKKRRGVGTDVRCYNCNWRWNTIDSDESDKYVCHKCGKDNSMCFDSKE